MLQRLNHSVVTSILIEGDPSQIHAERCRMKRLFHKCKTALKSIMQILDAECKCGECQEYYKHNNSPVMQDEPRASPVVLSVAHLPFFSAAPPIDNTLSCIDKNTFHDIPLATYGSSAPSTPTLGSTITDKRSDQHTSITPPLSFFAAATLDQTDTNKKDQLVLNSQEPHIMINETFGSQKSEFDSDYATRSKGKTYLRAIQSNMAGNTIPALPIVVQENKNTFDSFSYHILDIPHYESNETEKSSMLAPEESWFSCSYSQSANSFKKKYTLAENLAAIRAVWPDYSCPLSFTPTKVEMSREESHWDQNSFDSGVRFARELFESPPRLYFPKKQPSGLNPKRSLLSDMIQKVQCAAPFDHTVRDELSSSLERHVAWENKVNCRGLIKKETRDKEIKDLTVTHPNIFVTFW